MIITRRDLLRGATLTPIIMFGGGAKAYAVDQPSFKSADALDYFDRVAAYVDARFASRLNASVSRIASLDDLAGNTYTLVECKPAGVYILHDASGQFAEYGENSLSPYRDTFGRLIYAGPGSYFCETSEGFVDLSDDTLVKGSRDDVVRSIADNTARMHEQFIANPCDSLLEVLQPFEGSMNAAKVRSEIKELIDGQTRSISIYRVPSYTFFSVNNSQYCGYWTHNGVQVPGYVAANLMYRYWNYRGQVSLYSYWTSTTGVQNATYTQWLFNCGVTYLGLSESTNAWDIVSLMNGICSYYGMTQAASWEFLNAGAWAEISSNHRPVILFGSPTNFGSHAFVAYGVQVDTSAATYYFICHMGKNGSSYSAYNVNMTTLIGSNMKCSY